MTRRRPQYRNGNGNGHGFNLATVVQVFAIPAITGLIVLGGFYYVTRDELDRHDVAIGKTIPEEFKQEAQARERSRTEFLDKLDKLNTGVSTLNTNVAVQTQALQALKDSLAARR